MSTQLPLHSVAPSEQEQTPPLQLAPSPLQPAPQRPQCTELVSTSTQPPPQACWAAGQPQTPAAQVWPVPQVREQLPQCLESRLRSTQAPSHSLCPGPQ